MSAHVFLPCHTTMDADSIAVIKIFNETPDDNKSKHYDERIYAMVANDPPYSTRWIRLSQDISGCSEGMSFKENAEEPTEVKRCAMCNKPVQTHKNVDYIKRVYTKITHKNLVKLEHYISNNRVLKDGTHVTKNTTIRKDRYHKECVVLVWDRSQTDYPTKIYANPEQLKDLFGILPPSGTDGPAPSLPQPPSSVGGSATPVGVGSGGEDTVGKKRPPKDTQPRKLNFAPGTK